MNFSPQKIGSKAAIVLLALLVGVGPQLRAQSAAAQKVRVQGELQVLALDFKDRGHISYSLKLQDGSVLPLKFMKEPSTHFATGTQVEAEGNLSNGTLVLYSGATGMSSTTTVNTITSSTSFSNTLGAQSTLVILVNFQDSPTQPYTVSDAQNMFFGTANGFVSENSYGQTSLVGDVAGWFTIPDSITTCNMTQIATDAQNAAAAAGVNLSSYARYVYAFPYNTVCGWAGSSYVGGNPSQSWINGNALDIHTVAHELGHAFGLWHSHLLDCGTSATIGTNCSVVEYGDFLDVMGGPQTASPHYNAFQKEQLGWLNSGVSPAIQTVQSSGSYTIYPYEVGGAGPNALKVLKSTDPSTGAKTWYYLEARQPIGFDAYLSDGMYYTQNETSGVLFHTGTAGDGNTSELLDMTPQTSTASGWLDNSLVVGQSFQDSAANVIFSVNQAGGTGATVQVTLGNSPTSLAALSVSTNQSSYCLGQTVMIAVTATNGSSPAAGISISTTVVGPNGKATTMKATTSANGIASFSYKLSRRSPLGNYQVQASTSGSGSGASAGASTSFVVQ